MLGFFHPRLSSRRIFLLLLLLIASPLFSAGSQKLELIRADQIKSFTRNKMTYRRLVGNVELRRGDALLTCDVAEFQVQKDEAILRGQVKIVTTESKLSGKTAYYFGKRDYVELVGNARFEDDPYFVTAEKMGYYIEQQKVMATDTPVLIDSGSTLTADTIFYFEDTQLGDARGHALMINDVDSLSVKGQHLLYYAGKDSLLSYGDAEFQKWTDKDTTLRIESDSLSLEQGYFFAWQNVELVNGDAVGTCGRAVYMQDDDVAIMHDNPELREEDFILTGDVFNLHMQEGELTSVYVPENPYFTQKKKLGDTTYTDWLDGKIMAVEFQEGEPQTVTMVEMATSFFNVIEEHHYKGSNKVSGDTLLIVLSDSSISDITVTGGAEGEFKPAEEGADIEFPIKYKADRIAYSLEHETTLLQKNASIDYGKMSMAAGQVGVYWRQNLLRARSLVDTLGSQDFPVLKQKGQEDFQGQTMIYDLKTQRGKVTAGRTKMDEGNYFGEKVTRVNSDVYLMSDGYYTTCSLEEHPHFYFYSKQMKLFTDKIIIAKPVVLYIADVPLIALPFAIFPQKKGRTSGFIMPSYDYRPSNGGRGIKGLGYYWAMSDYSDFKMTGDFWDEREEFKLQSVLRYKKRYRINGSINASMASVRNALNRPATWGWKLNFVHNQTIDPSFSIRANGKLSGDANFDRTYSHDQEERLKTLLHSGITINKKFESIGSNVVLAATYNEDLQVTRRVEEAPKTAGIRLSGPTLGLPSFSFSRASSPIIKAKGNETRWYNNFRWSYRNRLQNTRKWNYLSYDNQDTLNENSFSWDEEVVDRKTWIHNSSLSGDTQVLKVLKVVGSVSYQDAWGFRYLTPELDNSGQALVDSNGLIETQEKEAFIRRGTLSTSLRMNTKLYGIFPIHIGSLRAVRHTLTPSVSLSYTPDFSTEFWGYIKKITDTTGAIHPYDRFAGSDLGATPARDALRMSYNINNIFDYKLIRKGVESKDQFFTWSMSGSYNFKADSLKASDISNNFKINFGKNFKLSPRATFEIYERDSSGTRKVNIFRFPRMTKASFSFGFRLQGDLPGGSRSMGNEKVPADSIEADAPAGFIQDRQDIVTGKRGGKPAWTASFNFRYSYNQPNPTILVRQTFNVMTSIKLNLSENWGLTYNPSFNLMDMQLVGGTVGVTRDLHCWNLTLRWTPMGRWGGLNLTIKPKARQLQDLKFEHTANRRY